MLRKRTRAALELPHKHRRRAVDAGDNSQILFKDIFQSGPEANVLVNESGKIIAANLAADDLFGYPHGSLLGVSIEVLVPEPLRAQHIGLHHDYISGLSTTRPSQTSTQASPDGERIHRRPDNNITQAQRELTARRSDGSIFSADITLNPISTGQETLVLCIIRDIEERKEREKSLTEQSGLVQLLQDVAIASNEANNIEDAFRFAIDRLVQYLQWPVGHALLLRDDPLISATTIWNKNLSEQFTAFREKSEVMHFKPGDGLAGMVLNSGQPVWITNLPNHPQFMRSKEAREVGLKTWLAVPVMNGQRVVGVLEFFHEQTIAPNPNLLAVLPHIGKQLGRVVERKRVEDELRRSAARLRMVLTNLPVFLWVMDRQGKVIMMEGRSVNALHIDTSEILGRSAIDLAAQRPDVVDLIRRALTGETIHTEIINSTGAVSETYLTPYYDVNWAVDGVIGLSFDVSERKRMESELDEMKHRMLEAVENERARLGQRLHDGPLQDLYGAFYEFQEIIEKLGEHEQDSAALALSTLQQVTTTLRMICGELHPSTLVHLGLQRSIRSHAERLQEQLDSITIHLDLSTDEMSTTQPGMIAPSMLAASLRLALFRIYQQLIDNATRHAQAQHIWVRLWLPPGQVILEVQDNGLGFDLPKNWIELVRQGQLGLVSTLERVGSLNGKLEIETRPGTGTLVRVIVST